MPVLDRSGLHLNYHEAGTGHPPMVFVHGWTCNYSFFSPQLDHFEKHHRVVGIDLRGHGDSDSPEGDYGMEVLAEDVAWLCRRLGIAGAVVVGHSMGGAVGVELVARHPELASALVLVDSPMSASAEARAMLAGHLEFLRGPNAAKARRAGIEMMFLPTDDAEVKARVVAEMMRPPDRVAAACIQGLLEWDLASAWAAVTVPILNIDAERPTNQPASLVSPGPRWHGDAGSAAVPGGHDEDYQASSVGLECRGGQPRREHGASSNRRREWSPEGSPGGSRQWNLFSGRDG